MSKQFSSIVGILVVVGVLAAALAGAGLRAASGAADKPNSWGFDTANLDTTCKPCDDFYQFAMGGWMKANPIPPEYSSWGTFTQLADKNQQNLRQILDDAVNAKARPGSNEQKIGDFYASCMDLTAIDAAGTKPLEPELARIAGINSVADVQADTERLQTRGVGALFRFAANQDAKDSTRVIGAAFQGGLGLPARVLPEGRRQIEAASRGLHQACRKNVRITRGCGRPVRSRTGHDSEDRDGSGNRFDEKHRSARSGQDLSQDDAGRPEDAHAEFFLGSLLPGRGTSGIERNQRRPAGFFQGPRCAIDRDPYQRLEHLFALASG